MYFECSEFGFYVDLLVLFSFCIFAIQKNSLYISSLWHDERKIKTQRKKLSQDIKTEEMKIPKECFYSFAKTHRIKTVLKK